jgi:hypothetical protein
MEAAEICAICGHDLKSVRPQIAQISADRFPRSALATAGLSRQLSGGTSHH